LEKFWNLSPDPCTRKLLELEPWQEIAHRQLIRLLAANGQRTAALAQFEVCKRCLKEELGVEPMIETVQLYENIRDNHSSVSAQKLTPSHNLPVALTPLIGPFTPLSLLYPTLPILERSRLTVMSVTRMENFRTGMKGAIRG